MIVKIKIVCFIKSFGRIRVYSRHMYKPSGPIFLIRIKTDEMVNDQLKVVPLMLGRITRP